MMPYLGEIATDLVFGALALDTSVGVGNGIDIRNGARRDGDDLDVVGAFTIGILTTVTIYTVVGAVIDAHDLVTGIFTVGIGSSSGSRSGPTLTASFSWFPRSLASRRGSITRVQICPGATLHKCPWLPVIIVVAAVLLVKQKRDRGEGSKMTTEPKNMREW